MDLVTDQYTGKARRDFWIQLFNKLISIKRRRRRRKRKRRRRRNNTKMKIKQDDQGILKHETLDVKKSLLLMPFSFHTYPLITSDPKYILTH